MLTKVKDKIKADINRILLAFLDGAVAATVGAQIVDIHGTRGLQGLVYAALAAGAMAAIRTARSIFGLAPSSNDSGG